jgi:hypothetical protein
MASPGLAPVLALPVSLTPPTAPSRAVAARYRSGVSWSGMMMVRQRMRGVWLLILRDV